MVAKGDFRLSSWEGGLFLGGSKILVLEMVELAEFVHINHRFELFQTTITPWTMSHPG